MPNFIKLCNLDKIVYESKPLKRFSSIWVLATTNKQIDLHNFDGLYEKTVYKKDEARINTNGNNLINDILKKIKPYILSENERAEMVTPDLLEIYFSYRIIKPIFRKARIEIDQCETIKVPGSGVNTFISLEAIIFPYS